MKTIKELQIHDNTNVAATHRYDHITKKIYDVETHKHLLKVRDDIAAGRAVWIPKGKSK